MLGSWISIYLIQLFCKRSVKKPNMKMFDIISINKFCQVDVFVIEKNIFSCVIFCTIRNILFIFPEKSSIYSSSGLGLLYYNSLLCQYFYMCDTHTGAQHSGDTPPQLNILQKTQNPYRSCYESGLINKYHDVSCSMSHQKLIVSDISNCLYRGHNSVTKPMQQ